MGGFWGSPRNPTPNYGARPGCCSAGQYPYNSYPVSVPVPAGPVVAAPFPAPTLSASSVVVEVQ